MVFLHKAGRVIRAGQAFRDNSSVESEQDKSGGSYSSKVLGQVNNPSSSFQTGLGTGSPLLSPIIKPSGTSISFGGGSLHHGLKHLSFDLEEKKGKGFKSKNVKLKA